MPFCVKRSPGLLGSSTVLTSTLLIHAAGAEVSEGAGLPGSALLYGAVLPCACPDHRVVLQPQHPQKVPSLCPLPPPIPCDLC